VLDTLAASAPGLPQIDQAAADLSTRVLPVVRARLAALTAGRADDRPGGGGPVRQVRQLPPARGAARPMLVGIGASAAGEPLRAARADAAARWSRAGRRDPRAAPPRALEGPLAPRAVASADAERALALEILGYAVTSARDVPLARARVRVRISDAS